MPYLGWVCCWTSLLLCSKWFLSGYTGICLSSKNKGWVRLNILLQISFTMSFGPLKYYICQNTLFQADLQTLKCKQMIFEVYSIHSYSGILSIEHSLTFPNSNSTWNGRQRPTMWIPFPLNYLFLYSFIFFNYALLDECFTPKDQLTKETIPRNKFCIWTVLLTIMESEKSGLSFEGWEKS